MKWAVLVGALLLALLTIGGDEPPRIVEGEKKELAGVRSVFVVTNDAFCRSEFCAVLEAKCPELRVVTTVGDADAILVLTTSLEHEVVALPDSGGCAPCQAQAPTPRRLDIETRKVVLSVLLPTGVNEYRRIYFTSASGGFGGNPEERLALQFVKTWKKWDRKTR